MQQLLVALPLALAVACSHPPPTTAAPPATAASSPAEPPAEGAPASADGTPKAGGGQQGSPCVDGKCGAGLTCIQFHGVAGPRGPRLTACEIPCSGPERRCPEGQSCGHI